MTTILVLRVKHTKFDLFIDLKQHVLCFLFLVAYRVLTSEYELWGLKGFQELF